MAETRHRTVLEVAVRDREVKDLGKEVRHALDPKAVEAFEAAVKRAANALGEMGHRAMPPPLLTPAGRARAGAPAHARPPALLTREARQANDMGQRFDRLNETLAKLNTNMGRQSNTRRDTFLGSMAGTMAGRYLTRASSAVGSAGQPQGFTAALAGAVPGIGPAAGGMLGGIQQFFEEFLAEQRAQLQSFGASGRSLTSPNDVRPLGAFYGLAGPEMASTMAETAQRSGRSGSGLSPDLLNAQLMFQRVMGISSAANVVGAQESSGGRVQRPEDLMMRSIASAFEAGIRAVDVDKTMMRIAQGVEGIRERGINFSADTANSLLRGFAGLGASFRGDAGLRTSQQAQTAFTSELQNSSIATTLRLQAARSIAGPDADMLTVMEVAESGSKDMVRRTLEMVRDNFKNYPIAIRETLKALGMDASPRQIRDFIDGDFSSFDKQVNRRPLDREFAERQPRFSEGVGALRTEAQHRNRRAETGREVQHAAELIRESDISIATSLAPLIAGLVEQVGKLVEEIKPKRAQTPEEKIKEQEYLEAVTPGAPLIKAWESIMGGTIIPDLQKFGEQLHRSLEFMMNGAPRPNSTLGKVEVGKVTISSRPLSEILQEAAGAAAALENEGH